ncbi:hypothetical protein M885DRAFT_506942 [Pelagophyceae sp. CCMP2097]|nr:hypothetical protein M885DRAFT_506942 [Pelagophyceae sp. CCMP2097]
MAASAAPAKSLFTVLPWQFDLPSDVREFASVDSALVGFSALLDAAALTPLVLLPPKLGGGTVVGEDAVVLFFNPEAPRGKPNRRASLFASAAGAVADVYGDAVVGRFRLDGAETSLGGEAAPALLTQRCWLEKAQANAGDGAGTAAALAALLQFRLAVGLAAKATARAAAQGGAMRDDGAPAAVGEAYTWQDNRTDVDVTVPLPPGAKKGHVRVNITAERLAVHVGRLDGDGAFAMAAIVDGALFQTVKPEDCDWSIVHDADTTNLHISLVKARAMRWLVLTR